MKFTRQFLREALEDAVYDEQVDSNRWESLHEMVFEHEGKMYRAEYRRGLTEYQDTYPFDSNHDDEIECPEVEQVQVTTTEWRVKK